MPGNKNTKKLAFVTTAISLYTNNLLLPAVQSVPIMSAADILRQNKSLLEPVNELKREMSAEELMQPPISIE